MATNLQSYVSEAAAGAASDLQPLVANETFRAKADTALADADKAAVAAAAAASLHEDVMGTVQLFASATRALRAVAKRYPESSKFIDEAMKQTQLAMGAIAFNPQPPPKTAGTVTATGATVAPPVPPRP